MPGRHRKQLEGARAIGYWVLGILAPNELAQWGKDGGTELPFPNKREATRQAQWLVGQAPMDTYYIMTIFNTGQILTEEV